MYYPPHLIVLAAVKIASKHTGLKIDLGGITWYKAFTEETTEDEVERLVSVIYDYLGIETN